MRNSNVQSMKVLSAAADQNGAAIDASQMLAASVQVVTTGTSTGTLKMQFSNDTPAQCTTGSTGKLVPTNWTDITSQSVAVAAAGAVGIMKFDCCYQFIRPVWTHTNGAAGTVSVEVNAKGF